jgi:predicted RNA-binding Zn-ribbon protein involved in translation (DUF1610 family)
MPSLEDQCYEIAAREVAESNLAPAAYGKALSAAMGDKEKITALYIKFRVAQLIQETAEAWKKAVMGGEEITCPKCGQRVKAVRCHADIFAWLFGWRGEFSGKGDFQYSCPTCSEVVMRDVFTER